MPLAQTNYYTEDDYYNLPENVRADPKGTGGKNRGGYSENRGHPVLLRHWL